MSLAELARHGPPTRTAPRATWWGTAPAIAGPQPPPLLGSREEEGTRAYPYFFLEIAQQGTLVSAHPECMKVLPLSRLFIEIGHGHGL